MFKLVQFVGTGLIFLKLILFFESQERYINAAIYRKNDISAIYRREALISRRIIVATHRLYLRYIAKISLIYRKNKERYSAIIVCIAFSQYCMPMILQCDPSQTGNGGWLRQLDSKK